MGNAQWGTGGQNECVAYWKAARPGIKPESADLWCQRWFIDNHGATKPNRTETTGWGYSYPYEAQYPYIDLYRSFNDVAGTYFGGRTIEGNAKCYAVSRKYYGMDQFTEQQVDDYYCYGTQSSDDEDCGGFFENIGCGIENVGGSFGDFISRTLPRMFENGLNALGVGADFIAWLLANWVLVLGVVAGLFVLGFLLWAFKN